MPTPIANSTTTPRVPSFSSTLMSAGDSGAQVADLQTTLKSLGFDPKSGTPADGRFGPNTQAALKAFQKSQGLKADGVVGPDTRRALANPKPMAAAPSGDGFECKPKAPVALATPPKPAPVPANAAAVIASARSELGRNAADVKVGDDAIGKAMRDDVSNWKCCANFVGAALRSVGQISDKDLSASVDGLVGKLRKTGNFTESHRLADAQPGDVVAFDHAHVMICTGRDAKSGEPTFIGSNNMNKDGSQKITEGTLKSMLGPKTLQAWEQNAVVMHYDPK
jgi:hypothetical protein